MDADDQGHRHGNFPNYYAFHPPKNRLDVLGQTNILGCLRRGLRLSDEDFRTRRTVRDGSSSDGAEDTENGAALEDGSAPRKKPRVDGSDGKRPSSMHDVYYCDLGCNEGDLTMAMAKALADATPLSGGGCCTTKSTDEALTKVKSTPLEDEDTVAMKCLGLDLDPMLIERASAKFASNKSAVSRGEENGERGGGPTTDCTVDATFKVCNLCSASEHDDAYHSFARGIKDKAKDDAAEATPAGSRSNIAPLFHLTTIFSTTMWIHVHAGDDGLREFLERACSWTKRYLLIEPQPSGCYRKANVRLRKMGRPELDDVTSSRLKMRPDIEGEIEKVVIGCGFRRVTLDELVGANNDYPGTNERQGDVTSWNRTLNLYERVSDNVCTGASI